MAMFDRPHVFEVHALNTITLFFYRETRKAYKVSGEQRQRQEQDCAHRQAAPEWMLSDTLDNTTILKRTSLHSFHRRPSTCTIL